MKKGECIYIPNIWSYALKTNSVWLYSISWEKFNQTVSLELCNGNKTNRNETSDKFLSDYSYLSEFNQSQANVETLYVYITQVEYFLMTLNKLLLELILPPILK